MTVRSIRDLPANFVRKGLVPLLLAAGLAGCGDTTESGDTDTYKAAGEPEPPSATDNEDKRDYTPAEAEEAVAETRAEQLERPPGPRPTE